VLTDSDGGVLSEYEVRLRETDWQFEAFADLSGHLFWKVAPDRIGGESEEHLVAEVGEWIGANVFGPIATTLVENCPATVTVTVPNDARDLLLRPLQLALRLPNTSSVQVNGMCRLGMGAIDPASDLVLWSRQSLGHDGRLCCFV
jgi:hypothetical protein